LKTKKKTIDHPVLPPGMLNGGVPPINVLIVEDNPINLKLLEAFVKRLKVRWKTAMNGKEAVDKWKMGGFHLVLMDIQLPVMSGLQATREIRRLERLNSIGVFSSSAESAPGDPEAGDGKLEDKDRLEKPEMFKSPVIIVALTASSLQSDRHEALAAGCNDFLTKVSIPSPPTHIMYRPSRLTINTARQLCLARAQGHGVGLHAGPDRL
jgi:osomolarity two-component system response regulator SSK1